MATRTVAAAGGAWNVAATWVEGDVPALTDDVVMAATSGPLTIPTSMSVVCRSFDSRNSTADIIFGNTVSNISMTATATGGGLLGLGAQIITTTGVFNFSSTGTQVADINFAGHEGKYRVGLTGTGIKQLLAPMSVQPATGSFSFSAGTLRTNDHKLTLWNFTWASNAVKTFDLGSSTVEYVSTVFTTPTTTNGSVDFLPNTATFSFTGASLAFNPVLGKEVWNFNGASMHFLSQTARVGAVQLNAGHQADNPTALTGIKDIWLSPPAGVGDVELVVGEVGMTGQLRLVGNSGAERVILRGAGVSTGVDTGISDAASERTLSPSSIVATECSLYSIAFANPTLWNVGAYGALGDGGGNGDNIMFDLGEVLYPVFAAGTTQNWSNPAIWAANATAAAGTGRVPLPQDDVNTTRMANSTTTVLNVDRHMGRNLDMGTTASSAKVNVLAGVTSWLHGNLANNPTASTLVSASTTAFIRMVSSHPFDSNTVITRGTGSFNLEICTFLGQPVSLTTNYFSLGLLDIYSPFKTNNWSVIFATRFSVNTVRRAEALGGIAHMDFGTSTLRPYTATCQVRVEYYAGAGGIGGPAATGLEQATFQAEASGPYFYGPPRRDFYPTAPIHPPLVGRINDVRTGTNNMRFYGRFHLGQLTKTSTGIKSVLLEASAAHNYLRISTWAYDGVSGALNIITGFTTSTVGSIQLGREGTLTVSYVTVTNTPAATPATFYTGTGATADAASTNWNTAGTTSSTPHLQGGAQLTSASAMSAAGAAIALQVGLAALDAASALAVDGQTAAGVFGELALSSSSDLTIEGFLELDALADLESDSLLSADGLALEPVVGLADLLSDSALTAEAFLEHMAAVALDADSAMLTDGVIGTGAEMAGDSMLTVSEVLETFAALALSSASALSAEGEAMATGLAELLADSQMALAEDPLEVLALSEMASDSTLEISVFTGLFSFSALIGDSGLAVNGFATTEGLVELLSAESALTADGLAGPFGEALLSSDSALAVGQILREAFGAALLNATSALVAESFASRVAATSLSSTSALSVSAFAQALAALALASSTTLTVGAAAFTTGASQMSSTSSLLANGGSVVFGLVSLPGSSSMEIGALVLRSGALRIWRAGAWQALPVTLGGRVIPLLHWNGAVWQLLK